jgi:CRISPR-associated protein Cas5t
MLLSLVGTDWWEKERFKGVKLALALDGIPEKSMIFRKFRRVGQSNKKADPLTARRPDYQELLLWLKMWVWVNDGISKNSLVAGVNMALNKKKRAEIKRYGGLSLGESTHLVNEIILGEPENRKGSFLLRDKGGFFSFPVWVDHQRTGENRSFMDRFTISEAELLIKPESENDPRWITIDNKQTD